MRNEEEPPILYSSLRRSMEVMEARGISSGILDFLRFVLDVLPMQVKITMNKVIASKSKKSLRMAHLPFL